MAPRTAVVVLLVTIMVAGMMLLAGAGDEHDGEFRIRKKTARDCPACPICPRCPAPCPTKSWYRWFNDIMTEHPWIPMAWAGTSMVVRAGAGPVGALIVDAVNPVLSIMVTSMRTYEHYRMFTNAMYEHAGLLTLHDNAVAHHSPEANRKPEYQGGAHNDVNGVNNGTVYAAERTMCASPQLSRAFMSSRDVS